MIKPASLLKPARAPFLTGSRAYGTPRPDSDFDFVVYEEVPEDICWQDAEPMHIIQGALVKQLNPANYSVKYGVLNLMVFRDPALYDLALTVTNKLIAQKPVTREYAVSVFNSYGLTEKAS